MLCFEGKIANFEATNARKLGKQMPKGQMGPFSRMYTPTLWGGLVNTGRFGKIMLLTQF